MRVQDPPNPGYHPGIDGDGHGDGEPNRSWLRRHGVAIFLACLLVFGGVTILTLKFASYVLLICAIVL